VAGNRRTFRTATQHDVPPKLDLHGDPLPPGALTRYGTARLRHGSRPSLEFTPDGKFLASIYHLDDGIRLWDPATGKERYRLNSPVSEAVFARDGSILVMDHNRFKVWIPAANSVREIPAKWNVDPGDSGYVYLPDSIAVHPDCRSFAVGFQGKILQFDLQTGKQIRELNCLRSKTPTRLVFSPDGRWLAGSGDQTGVCLWDLRTGKRARTYLFKSHEFTFSPDGTRIAISADQLLWINSTDSEEMIENYRAPKISLRGLRFSNDGKWLFGIDDEGKLQRIDTASGGVTEWYAPPDQNLIRPTTMAPEGLRVAAIEQESGAIRIWGPKARNGPKVSRLAALSNPGFSADGKVLWCLASDGKIHAFDAFSGKDSKVIDLPIDKDTSVTWDPNHRRAAVFLPDKENCEMRVIDVDTSRILYKTTIEVRNAIPPLAISEVERSRAAIFGPGSISIIDFSTGKQLRTITYSDAVHSNASNANAQPDIPTGAFSPDGRLVAICTHPLSLWEVSTGKKRLDLDPLLRASKVIFSNDGRFLAAWDVRGTIMVFDVPLGAAHRRLRGEEILQIDPQRWSDFAMAFSVDGKWLAAGDSEGGITIWDLATGDVHAVFDRHEGPVTGLAFSPDGSRLASTSRDGTVLVWRVPDRPPEIPPDARVRGIDQAFKILLSSDAALAHRGMEYLYRRPVEAVKLCGERIAVPAAVPPEKIAKLIAELGSDDFPIRQAAVKDLETMGGPALASLRECATQSSSPEARKLASEVIGRLKPVSPESVSPKGEDLRIMRAVEILENIGGRDARALLARWAAGPQGYRLTNEAATAVARLKSREK
jgi:WD40 repeat protein